MGYCSKFNHEVVGLLIWVFITYAVPIQVETIVKSGPSDKTESVFDIRSLKYDIP